jgi:glutamyl-tRNA synthetase
MKVRVRYAPSPTGLQHIGGIRTALFDYFFSRSQDGAFVLRVEDTDQARTTDDAMQDLYDTWTWLGIEWDEGPDKGGPYGPYIQSERADIYKQHADKLVSEGYAYPCFCSQERLDSIRAEQEGNKEVLGYDRHCRNLTGDERASLAAETKPVIRIKVPLEGKTTAPDLLRGDVTRKNADIPADPILLKSDGMPTYHLASVVDDHLMEISHVFRGQEWLPSAQIHILLYKAFGWELPVFCHLPIVLGKDGQKLSKRHGATSLQAFREAGYLPEAIINYVSMLGWSYDDQREFFSKEELEKLFTLNKLNKAPAVFDFRKLEWFNGQYIRKKPDIELEELILPYLVADGVVSDPVTENERRIIDGMMPLVRERLRLLPEISGLVGFLFKDVRIEDPAHLVPKKLDEGMALATLKKSRDIMEDFADRTDEENEALFREAAEQLSVKLGDMLMPLRVSVTGSASSPPLFGSVRLLGKEKTLQRIESAIKMLES